MSAPQKRAAVRYLVERRGCSQRRACRLAGIVRTVARYQAKLRHADEPVLVERLKEIAQKRHRRGYRLAHQELRGDGWQVNHKRVHRLWKHEGLSVPPRRSRKRVRSKQAVTLALAAHHPNAVWCLDFLEDRTISGGKLRVLAEMFPP